MNPPCTHRFSVMKHALRIVGMVAAVAMLAACHRGQDITFDGHSISLHASGQPTATITSRGSFSVGSKLVDVTPAQRQLFLRYYNRATAIHADTQALKQAGVNLAGKTLKAAGESIKQAVAPATGGSTSPQAPGAVAQAAGDRITRRAHALCQEVQQAQALQALLSTQVPAFKPYADIETAPGVHCAGADSAG